MKPVKRRHKLQQLGFTLIELLVVIFIIGIVTGVALLNFHQSEERQMQGFVKELSQVLALAQDRAMLQRKIIGFSVDQDTYYFANLIRSKKANKMIWDMMNDEVFTTFHVPKNITLRLRMANMKAGEDDDELSDDAANSMHDPQVLIFSNRDMTPFMILVAIKNKKPHYAIYGNADGSIHSQAIS